MCTSMDSGVCDLNINMLIPRILSFSRLMGRTYRLLGDSLVHASRAVRLLHLHVGSIPLVLLGSLTAREPGLDSFEHVGRIGWEKL